MFETHPSLSYFIPPSCPTPHPQRAAIKHYNPSTAAYDQFLNSQVLAGN